MTRLKIYRKRTWETRRNEKITSVVKPHRTKRLVSPKNRFLCGDGQRHKSVSDDGKTTVELRVARRIVIFWGEARRNIVPRTEIRSTGGEKIKGKTVLSPIYTVTARKSIISFYDVIHIDTRTSDFTIHTY